MLDRSRLSNLNFKKNAGQKGSFKLAYEGGQIRPHQSFGEMTDCFSGTGAPRPAHVVKVPHVLIPAQRYNVGALGRSEERTPTFELTLQILQRCNVPADQMVLYEGQPMPADSFRAHPYRVIAIPYMNMEIAVTDQRESAMMVSSPMRGRFAYAAISPLELFMDNDTRMILPDNNPKWDVELADIIKKQPREAPLDATGMQSFLSEKPHITANVFAKWVAGNIVGQRKVPEYRNKNIPGAAEGENWTPIIIDLDNRSERTSSLPPEGYRDLIMSQCREGRYDEALATVGLSPYQAGIKRNFREPWIDGRIIETIHETGRAPRPGSGQILGADKGEIWMNIENAIRGKGRGLEALPDKGLMAYIRRRNEEGAFNAVLSERKMTPQDAGVSRIELSTADINADVINEIRQNGRAPTSKSGKKWTRAENAFRRGGGPDDCDAEDLSDFLRQQSRLGIYDDVLKEKNLSRYEAGLRRDFSLGWVDGRILAHVEEFSSAPGLASGQIIGADRGEIWKSVDNAMRQKERGLQGSPGKGLVDYLILKYEAGFFDEVIDRKKLKMEPNMKQRFRLLAEKPGLPGSAVTAPARTLNSPSL